MESVYQEDRLHRIAESLEGINLRLSEINQSLKAMNQNHLHNNMASRRKEEKKILSFRDFYVGALEGG